MLKLKAYLASNNIKTGFFSICLPNIDPKRRSFPKTHNFSINSLYKKNWGKNRKNHSQNTLNLKEHEKMPQENFFAKKELDQQLDFF